MVLALSVELVPPVAEETDLELVVELGLEEMRGSATNVPRITTNATTTAANANIPLCKLYPTTRTSSLCLKVNARISAPNPPAAEG